MSDRISRRRFLGTAAAGAAGVAAAHAAPGAETAPVPPAEKQPPFESNLVLNDDGHVFPHINDDLGPDDLRRYLQSYCRKSVGAVAYCVGDMTWPTLYPTKVGVHYSVLREGADLKRSRFYRNVARFESLSGGYFGTAFRIIHELGKKVLASFRMNDDIQAIGDILARDLLRLAQDLAIQAYPHGVEHAITDPEQLQGFVVEDKVRLPRQT